MDVVEVDDDAKGLVPDQMPSCKAATDLKYHFFAIPTSVAYGGERAKAMFYIF